MIRSKLILERASVARHSVPATLQARQFGNSIANKREDRPKSTEGLKPKILDEQLPPEEELSEEAQKHNREMKERAEQAVSGISNKESYKDTMPPHEKKTKDSASELDKKR